MERIVPITSCGATLLKFLSTRMAMAQPARFVCNALVCLIGAGLTAGALPRVAAQAPRPPQWTHALDLKARKSTEPTFTDKTRTFGVEVFRDDNNGNGVYLVETGAIAVTPNFKNVAAPVADSKAPEWMHGL